MPNTHCVFSSPNHWTHRETQGTSGWIKSPVQRLTCYAENNHTSHHNPGDIFHLNYSVGKYWCFYFLFDVSSADTSFISFLKILFIDFNIQLPNSKEHINIYFLTSNFLFLDVLLLSFIYVLYVFVFIFLDIWQLNTAESHCKYKSNYLLIEYNAFFVL